MANRAPAGRPSDAERKQRIDEARRMYVLLVPVFQIVKALRQAFGISKQAAQRTVKAAQDQLKAEGKLRSVEADREAMVQQLSILFGKALTRKTNITLKEMEPVTMEIEGKTVVRSHTKESIAEVADPDYRLALDILRELRTMLVGSEAHFHVEHSGTVEGKLTHTLAQKAEELRQMGDDDLLKQAQQLGLNVDRGFSLRSIGGISEAGAN